MAVFSFHPVKAITTGEGGMVTTRSESFRDRLTAFRTHGMVAAPQEEDSWLRQQIALGFNYRITDLQCALGRSQLGKLEKFVARRNELAARYRAAFSDVEELELAPAGCDGVRHAYHLFVIRHCGGAEARRLLYHRLRERNVLVQVHYLPVYLHPWYAERYGYAPGLCPEAERYYAGCLTLPCFPALSGEQQELVIKEVGRQAVLV
jgi:dTDP-4-amino-4,6-dideoxygalactose transaminase